MTYVRSKKKREREASFFNEIISRFLLKIFIEKKKKGKDKKKRKIKGILTSMTLL